jgi:hypothetical protein
MSVSNLFSPNNYNLFCDNLTANNITGAVTSITSAGITTQILATGSTASHAIINGIGTADPNFISFNTAPPLGGDIVLNAGVKAVLTDSTQMLINKTISDGIYTNWTLGTTADAAPIGLNNSSGKIMKLLNITDTNSVQGIFNKAFDTSTTQACVFGSSPPATAASTGLAGTITWDSGFIYVCIAANTWKRIAIVTW